MEFKNDLDVVAGVASRAVLHAKYHDLDGNVKDIMGSGSGNGLDLDSFRKDILPLSSDNHPSTGVDYFAGSLKDGEITGQYLLYQRDEKLVENPTKPKTITLLRDVGTKFNMAGDGATFLLHLQRTVMNAGVKGDVSDIELNYDVKNSVKEGYFTTTSVYPFYIKASDLATTAELDIPINGIGENINGRNFLEPHLKIKFNGDGTMTYTSITGYDNDGNVSGATGVNYDAVIDVIATFSTQPSVIQIPQSVNFFTGLSINPELSGVSNFYENALDGLEVTLDDFVYILASNAVEGTNTSTTRIPLDNLKVPKVIRIPKNRLIIGNKINLKELGEVANGNYSGEYKQKPTSAYWEPTGGTLDKNDGSYILINKNSLSIICSMNWHNRYYAPGNNSALNAIKITTYKE